METRECEWRYALLGGGYKVGLHGDWTAVWLAPGLQFHHTTTILRYDLSVTATSGLRHCDLNDLCRTVERPLNGRRIEVESQLQLM